MKTTTTHASNMGDVAYLRHRVAVQRLFESRLTLGPLCTTDADPDALWMAYLNSFQPSDQQYHNCNACRRFIQSFGNLVVVSPEGKTFPALLDISGFDVDSEAIYAMYQIVKNARVNGVFVSGTKILGTPITGEWAHVAVELPFNLLHTSKVQTPAQAMAEKAENFKNVSRALAEFPATLLGKAVGILSADAVYRADKVVEPARWLLDLATRADNAKGKMRENVIWNAVATAPNGFCHPRGSMIGTLLEDLKAGTGFDTVAKRFAEKMHPLQYQRPQAAPTAGNIARAEKLVESLGIQPSLERRFARVQEVPAVWLPTKQKETQASGVFGHLLGKEKAAGLSLPKKNVTAVKFLELANSAVSIKTEVQALGNFYAMLTAVNPDAPCLFQWGNHLSWYTYTRAVAARDWNLSAFQRYDVTAIVKDPSGSDRHIAIIAGCKDVRTGQGNAIFPENLIGELREVRATIEAYSHHAEIAGRDEASACGVALVGALFMLTDAHGVTAAYYVDRSE